MRRIDIKQSIRNHYFENPTARLRVRELERALKLPLPSVIRYCKELEKEGILARYVIGTTVYYTASRSEKYCFAKKLYNLQRLQESGLVRYLKEELSNPPIVLFGSFARGEDTEESDIDLYVECSTKKELKLEKYEKKLRREVNILQSNSLKSISAHLANNIINGITLNNQLEVYK